MRITPLVSGLLGLFGQTALAATDAPVTAVTLYPGSASIIRTAQVAQGATELVVSGLPAHFDQQTLRAEADTGIRLGEIAIVQSASIEPSNPAEAALEAQIETLQDQLALLAAEAASADIVKSFLERYSIGGGTADKPAADPGALAGVIATLGHGASEALSRVQRLAVERRKLATRIAALQRDLARIHSGAVDTRTVTISLEAHHAGSVRLSYQVNNAGWRPAYRAGLASATSSIDLERLATISQKTGEDWSNVKLTLSTSQPRQSPTGQQPQPWLLDFNPPVVEVAAPQFQAMARAVASPAPASVGANAGARADLYTPPTFEVQSAYATEFEVPARVNLASDGREVAVLLSKQTLAANQYLRVTPRIEQYATVIAETARPDGVWPGGNMQLFRDGNYIGATNWDLRDAEHAVFSFGRDELLKVAANQTGLKSVTAGAVGKHNAHGKHNARELADTFSVTNGHTTPVQVLVLESSPVSTSDQVKVQARFEPRPTVENWEQARGVEGWKASLAPQQTMRINVAYNIEYPQDGELVGLR